MIKRAFFILLVLLNWAPLTGAEDTSIDDRATALVAALSPINFDVDIANRTTTVPDQESWSITEASTITKHAQNSHSLGLAERVNNWINGTDLDDHLSQQETNDICDCRSFLIGALISKDVSSVNRLRNTLSAFALLAEEQH